MITLETLYPELFSEICKYLDNLSIIRFHQCSRYLYQNVKITDISMDLIINDEIIGRYQNLKFLSSPYNSKFEYLPKVNLQYLHVFIISQEELDAFIEQFNKISMPALTSLIISWNPDESHSPESIGNFTKVLESTLSRLKLKYFSLDTPITSIPLLKNIRCNENLELNFYDFSGEMDDPHSLRNLNEEIFQTWNLYGIVNISLSYTKVDLNFFSDLLTLKTLELRYCNFDINLLLKIPNLDTLSLIVSPETNEEIILPYLPNLQYLRLDSNGYIKFNISNISRMQNLQFLYFNFIYSDILNLSLLTDLKYLSLTGSGYWINLNSISLKSLEGFTLDSDLLRWLPFKITSIISKLEIISVNGNKQIFQILKKFKNLKKLTLKSICVDSFDVEFIFKNVPSLKKLKCNFINDCIMHHITRK